MILLGLFQVFLHLAWCWLLVCFIFLLLCLGFPDLSKTFNMMGYWILWKTFWHLMCVGFFFQFVYMVDYINGFSYIEPPIYPWNEAYLIMVADVLMCSWVWFGSILLRIFASIFIREIGLNFRSLLSFCVVHISGWVGPHRLSLAMFVCFYFVENFEENLD